MCLNCGCGEHNNRHGSSANITIGDVRAATRTAAHRSGTGGGARSAVQAIKRTANRRSRTAKTRD